MNREKLKKELNTRKNTNEICNISKDKAHYSKETKKDIINCRLNQFKEDNISKFYSCVMEECAELVQEVSKLNREKEPYNNIGILEEIVDVEICLKMLKTLMNTSKEDLKYIEDIKLDALLEKITENNL